MHGHYWWMFPNLWWNLKTCVNEYQISFQKCTISFHFTANYFRPGIWQRFADYLPFFSTKQFTWVAYLDEKPISKVPWANIALGPWAKRHQMLTKYHILTSIKMVIDKKPWNTEGVFRIRKWHQPQSYPLNIIIK